MSGFIPMMPDSAEADAIHSSVIGNQMTFAVNSRTGCVLATISVRLPSGEKCSISYEFSQTAEALNAAVGMIALATLQGATLPPDFLEQVKRQKQKASETMALARAQIDLMQGKGGRA